MEWRGDSMTKSAPTSDKQSASQKASEANRVAQMKINQQLGRPTPPPRDPEASRRAYEARHGGSTFRR
jgi:hypothetical protein